MYQTAFKAIKISKYVLVMPTLACSSYFSSNPRHYTLLSRSRIYENL